MKVAILSRGRTLYSTKRIADATRKAGFDVRIIDPFRSTFGVEGGRLVTSQNGLNLEDFLVVVPRIGVSSTTHGVAMLRQFELSGVATINSSDAILSSRDKFYASQRLALAHIPVPAVLTTRDSGSLVGLVERLGGPPVVIKMNAGTQGVGVIVAHSIESIQSTVQAMWSLGQDIILQEYIECRSDLRVFVVGDRAVAAMRRIAPGGDFRANYHRGGTLEFVKADEELAALGVKTASALGLDVAGVDIMEGPDGYLVLEANSSPGLEGIESISRVDVAKAIARLIASKSRQ